MATRIAILGTGSIGSRHLRIFSSLPGIEVVAIPLRGAERARQLVAEGYQVAESVATALPCDGLVIATDTGRHVDDLRQALTAGVQHVLVEKPLAPNGDALLDLWPILSAAQVFVGCCLRFAPGLHVVREYLPALGSVHSVTIQCRSYLPDWRPQRDYRQTYSARPDEGGVLRDLFHEVDYALWLFGVPDQVFARLGHSGRLGFEADDQASLFWALPVGTHLSIGLDYLTRQPVRILTAQGEQGSITWDAIKQTVQLCLVGRSPETFDVSHSGDAIYQAQARAFMAAIHGERSWPLATAVESAQGLAVCDSLRLSHQTGKMEPVARKWS